MIRHWKKRITGVLTAAGMLLSQAVTTVPTVTAAEQNNMNTLINGGLLQGEMIEISRPPMVQADIPTYSASSAFAATETTYEENVYTSYHGYEALSPGEQAVYNALKKAAHDFYVSSDTASEIEYQGVSGMQTMPCFTSLSISRYQLDTTDVRKVISMFRNDNPIYFFFEGSMLYSSTTTVSGDTVVKELYLACAEDYVDGTARQAERMILESCITEVISAWDDSFTAVDYAYAAHDWIVQKIDYAHDENGNPSQELCAHSIVGVFNETYQEAVCEGYAKAFQLLLNAVGIDNYYVIGLGNGGGHAWNVAQMDDGNFYYFDVTWDDTAETEAYFAAGETSFSEEHVPYTTEETGWYYLYDLPEVPAADYAIPKNCYTDGDFVYEMRGNSAVLTAYIGSAQSVTVPSSANGRDVTRIQGAFTGNSSLQEVILPETVTVITYGESDNGAFSGCVSLKYVVLPESVKTIDFDSFYACSALEILTIPASVECIGSYAFEGCTSLRQILIMNPECVITADSSIYAGTVIYGYSGSTAQTYAEKYERTFLSMDGGVGTGTTAAVTTATEITATTPEMTETIGEIVSSASTVDTTDTMLTTAMATTVETTIKSETTTSGFETTAISEQTMQQSSLTTTTTTMEKITVSLPTETTAATEPTTATAIHTTTTTATTVYVTKTTETMTIAGTTIDSVTAPTTVEGTTVDLTTTAATTTMPATTTGQLATFVSGTETSAFVMTTSVISGTTVASVVTEAETVSSAGTIVVTTVSKTETEEMVIGDITQDGFCRLNDVVVINLVAAGIVKVKPEQIPLMDCYHDNCIDTKDSMTLLQFLVRLLNQIPVEP